MKIGKQLLKILFISILLLSVLLIFRHPRSDFYEASVGYPYSAGNALDTVRSDIIEQLHKFQEGYTLRDTAQVDAFMEALFSQENALVIGTMPDEIYIGSKKISKLIYADWNAWGDCKFLIENAHISARGDVAWVSTIGTVKFDIPSFLILPLRLSGVMVREDQVWKFQFMQFQFDLSFFPLFFTMILLAAWWGASLVSLTITLIKQMRKAYVTKVPEAFP
jgi:hypothetical protein